MKTFWQMTGLLAVLLGLLVSGPAIGFADEESETPEEETVETVADFTLKDVDGKEHKLSDFRGKWVVLEWVNYDCPFVKKHYETTYKNMQTLQKTYTGKNVVWLSICSSAEGKQGYMTPESGKRRYQEVGSKATALLLDPDGKVGRAMGAKTTPDMRIISPKGVLTYTGAIDSTRSTRASDIPESKNYVKIVLDAVLAGEEPPVKETQPYGCSVKYAR